MTLTAETAPDVTATEPSEAGRSLKICLINPRFEPSYWGFDYALPMYPGDRRSTMINGALPTLAGLVPDHDVTILDENVEPIDYEALRDYDFVGVTGMTVQKKRMVEILTRLREMKIFTVVGGAYASVDEPFFDGLCDVLFTGEADTTWPRFVADFAAGRTHETFYEQPEQTDLKTLPAPRYDLLKVDRYASGSLQFSRGCPFQCEFCDIIVTFGRNPRVKESAQVIRELDEMRKAGFFSAFIVDDNFIGNKVAAKALMREIIPWQQKHGYPLKLSTEASVNLADDPELLELMYEANFRHVFMGIETPKAESLKETKKLQNTRGDSLDEKLKRVQAAGLDIYAGFIVGFDADDKEIFDEQFRFIQRNGIQLAMIGMLTAIPKTPLYKRLQEEGRLDDSDPNCNIIPKQMTREELQEGYWDLVQRVYTPEAFLDRYFEVYKSPEFLRKRADISKRAAEGKWFPTFAYGLILLANLVKTLAKDGSLRSVGKTYARYFFQRNLKVRRDVIGFAQFMNRCVTHWHFYRFTREASTGRLRLFNSG